MLIALEDSRELLALLHVCLLTVTLPLQNKIELVGNTQWEYISKMSNVSNNCSCRDVSDDEKKTRSSFARKRQPESRIF